MFICVLFFGLSIEMHSNSLAHQFNCNIITSKQSKKGPFTNMDQF